MKDTTLTQSELDDIMKLGESMTECGIASKSIRKGKCSHYSDRSKSCDIAFCKHGHRVSDGSCNTDGLIDDLYSEDIPVHNYFQSRGKI
jgi:hypothetical protein